MNMKCLSFKRKQLQNNICKMKTVKEQVNSINVSGISELTLAVDIAPSFLEI